MSQSISARPIALTLALLASTAPAQTMWHVDATGPGCPGDGTPANPYCAIQAAINAASTASGDTLLVAPGMYPGPLNFGSKDLVLRSVAGPDATCIDAQQLGRVITLESGQTSATVIEGFTITGGLVQGLPGGGIYCGSFTSPVIRGNRIIGNGSDWTSGGVFAATFASPTIVDNEIAFNWAGSCLGCPGASNGNLSGGGIGLQEGAAVVAGNLIHGNTAGYRGGGIVLGRGTPQIIDNEIRDNHAGVYGGGVNAASWSWVTVLRVERNVITDNSALFGGGFSSHAPTNTLLRRNVIRNNRATSGGWGAGVFAGGGGNVEARNNIIEDNESADRGGGIALNSSGSVFDGNAIVRNHALNGDGGGAYLNNPVGAMFRNNTWLDNSASGAGQHLSLGTGSAGTTVVSGVFWSTQTPGGDAISFSGSPPDVSHSLVQGGSALGWLGPGCLFDNPLLGPGYHLSAASPAIDSGDPGYIPPAWRLDVDGNPRLIGRRIDMGCDEVMRAIGHQ